MRISRHGQFNSWWARRDANRNDADHNARTTVSFERENRSSCFSPIYFKATEKIQRKSSQSHAAKRLLNFRVQFFIHLPSYMYSRGDCLHVLSKKVFLVKNYFYTFISNKYFCGFSRGDVSATHRLEPPATFSRSIFLPQSEWSFHWIRIGRKSLKFTAQLKSKNRFG